MFNWFFVQHVMSSRTLLCNYHIRVCPYMSSSTLRAMSNTGFLLLFSTCLLKKLEEKKKICVFMNSKTTELKLHDAYKERQLASKGPLPQKCKTLWRQSPSGASDTVLGPQSSPNTVDNRNIKVKEHVHVPKPTLLQCHPKTTIIRLVKMLVTCKPWLSGFTAILPSQRKHSTPTIVTFSNRFLRKQSVFLFVAIKWSKSHMS